MAQQSVSWFRTLRWAPILGAALLAACGGGSSDTPRQPAADGTAAALSANNSTISIRYRVADLMQGPSNHYTRRLSVIDTSIGQEVWHTFLNSDEIEHFSWIVSEGSELVPGTSASRYLGPQLLYYVSGGQVFQVDIGGSVTPTPQRISAVTNACAMDAAYAVERDGRHDWLVVHTSGPDNDCAQTGDNGQVLVSSGMAVTTNAITVPANQQVVLNRLPDAVSGQSTGMLTVDATLRRIVVRSNDLTTILHTLPGDVAPDQFIRILAPLPGQPKQWLVRVGADLRVFDQRAATPVLGPVLATLANPSIVPVYSMDNEGLYIANDHQVLSISAAGTVSTLTTLPSNGGTVDGLWLSKASVLVLQDESSRDTLPVTGRVLWSIQRGTATRQALVQGQRLDHTAVVYVEDGLVYYTQADGNFTTALRKVRDNGSGQELVASGIQMITEVIHPVISQDSVSLQKLVWCEPLAQKSDCGGARLMAYDTSGVGKPPLPLGTLSDDGASYTFTYALQVAWAGAQNPLHIPRYYYDYSQADGSVSERLDTSLWLFDADTANSLRQVTLTAP